jgi:hypothetical protein
LSPRAEPIGRTPRSDPALAPVAAPAARLRRPSAEWLRPPRCQLLRRERCPVLSSHPRRSQLRCRYRIVPPRRSAAAARSRARHPPTKIVPGAVCPRSKRRREARPGVLLPEPLQRTHPGQRALRLAADLPPSRQRQVARRPPALPPTAPAGFADPTPSLSRQNAPGAPLRSGSVGHRRAAVVPPEPRGGDPRRPLPRRRAPGSLHSGPRAPKLPRPRIGLGRLQAEPRDRRSPRRREPREPSSGASTPTVRTGARRYCVPTRRSARMIRCT